MIELRHLRHFIAVAEELHFGRAAARLFMTQPPLTQSIQALEADIGAPLFERTNRSVKLAPAGAALLEPARRLLQGAADLGRHARDAADGTTGRLRLGFVSSVAYGALPGWVRGFRKHCPDVALDLREATTDVQLAAFAKDELDVGFVLHAKGARVDALPSRRVGTEPFVLALPERHPLLAMKNLTLKQVASEPLILFPRVSAPSLYDALLAAYRHQGATPVIAQEAIQMQTIVNLVSVGMGIAWVPASLMQLRRPGVRYRALARAPVQCETSVVWSETRSPLVDRFVGYVEERL